MNKTMTQTKEETEEIERLKIKKSEINDMVTKFNERVVKLPRVTRPKMIGLITIT